METSEDIYLQQISEAMRLSLSEDERREGAFLSGANPRADGLPSYSQVLSEQLRADYNPDEDNDHILDANLEALAERVAYKIKAKLETISSGSTAEVTSSTTVVTGGAREVNRSYLALDKLVNNMHWKQLKTRHLTEGWQLLIIPEHLRPISGLRSSDYVMCRSVLDIELFLRNKGAIKQGLSCKRFKNLIDQDKALMFTGSRGNNERWYLFFTKKKFCAAGLCL